MDDHLLEKIESVETVHWWWEGRRQLLKMLLVGKKYEKILDIGCGTGETMTFLHKLYPKAQLYGIDSSAKAIKYVKSRLHKNVTLASATKLPFKDSFFDAVLFLDVLEHVQDDQKCITEAKRVLKKGGSVIITAPALSFIWSNYDIHQGHQRRYTRRRIRMLARHADLKVHFVSYFNFLFSPPIIAIRILSRLKSLNYLSSYDNSINLNIAKSSKINSLLKKIFITEINGMKYINYPLGISVAAVLVKN